MIGIFGMWRLFDGAFESREDVVVVLYCDTGRLVLPETYNSEQPIESIDITERRAKKPDAMVIVVLVF
jgi:hypothetical protein